MVSSCWTREEDVTKHYAGIDMNSTTTPSCNLNQLRDRSNCHHQHEQTTPDTTSTTTSATT